MLIGNMFTLKTCLMKTKHAFKHQTPKANTPKSLRTIHRTSCILLRVNPLQSNCNTWTKLLNSKGIASLEQTFQILYFCTLCKACAHWCAIRVETSGWLPAWFSSQDSIQTKCTSSCAMTFQEITNTNENLKLIRIPELVLFQSVLWLCTRD